MYNIDGRAVMRGRKRALQAALCALMAANGLDSKPGGSRPRVKTRVSRSRRPAARHGRTVYDREGQNCPCAYTDALTDGAVPLQTDGGSWTPLAYVSKSMTKA